jgi:hypothetical protein
MATIVGMTITKRDIEIMQREAKEKGQPYVIWDDKVSGFYVRISPPRSVSE